MKRSLLVIILTMGTMSSAGCALTPDQFYSAPSSFSAVSLCRTQIMATTRADYQLVNDVETELRNRLQTDPSQCNKIVSDNNMAIAGGVLAVVAVAALAASAADGGYSPGGYNTQTADSDYDWDWDQFYNQYNTLVWRCRGIQTGEFADDLKCVGDPRSDLRWPGK